VPLQSGGRERIDNVVLVVLESAGARYFDQYGGGYSITPHLARLAPRSLRGEHVYANTASSFLAMMSILSARQSEVSPAPAMPETPMLPGILRDAGLRTAFFHSSDTRSAGAEDFLAAAGFERVRDYRGRRCEAPLIADRSEFLSQGTLDRCTFDEMKRWIAAEPDRPFFAMLWTFQSHFDYFPGTTEPLPALEQGEFAGDPRRAGNKRRYLAALREADEQVGLLVDFLRAEGLADSTLVVVVGDHGESFDDHGQFGHGGSLYESAVQVPLVLINPSLSPQRSFDRLASHIDLAPTIVDLIGLPARGEWDGSSLFRPRRESPVIFTTPYIDLQVGYRLGDRKAVARLLDGRASVYDLAVDPQERRDLAAGNPDMQERELARIRSWVRHLNTRGAD
jgi:arylsulfatase A-like enzyme